MAIEHVLTQGTRIFFGTGESSIFKMNCATGVSGLGGSSDNIDTTCLETEDERTFEGGLATPGPVTMPFNFKPASGAQQALITLQSSKEKVSWMIVLSMQAGDVTTMNAANRLTSPGPTTAEFLAHVADLTFDVATNEIVRGTVTLQRSGAVTWDLPAASLP